ncbi:MAG: hypothetical protein A3I68_01220 [Candidatus Melainabacteria bacterium RIFCSPLOWO2_02_FULL_35_15]|nr:MAG: hypothetical protein A3F80_09025 [Candidatus Melainabacteria bacterium RIFCSPLOWO2_12_FULL_35_11]OGI13394.1 MAG: hypothetical protein A3I68_01220 [Candidatus Melainabacteria bacterium RIFCSPLOWO2_02_FULL_35_15]
MLDLNTIVVISLAILAFFSLVVVIVLIPIALQFSRTLSSLQSLLDTINDDVKPTVKEIKQSVYNVKTALKKGTSVLESGAHEASMFVASSAHGILAGVKEYFLACKTDENSYNNNGSPGIRR